MLRMLTSRACWCPVAEAMPSALKEGGDAWTPCKDESSVLEVLMVKRRDRSCLSLATGMALLLSFQPAVFGAPHPADAPPADPASGMGWGPGPMGQRSADARFIVMMIPHHRMGVMMASHAQWNTRHPRLRELEAAMVRVQSQEIAQMSQWYRQSFGASRD